MAAWIISVVVETIVGDTVASQLTVQPPVSRLFPSSDHCRQFSPGQTEIKYHYLPDPQL